MKNKINEIRKYEKMTQKQLAEKIKLSERQINRIENDKSNPKMNTLEKIATALHTTVNNLLCEK